MYKLEVTTAGRRKITLPSPFIGKGSALITKIVELDEKLFKTSTQLLDDMVIDGISLDKLNRIASILNKEVIFTRKNIEAIGHVYTDENFCAAFLTLCKYFDPETSLYRLFNKVEYLNYGHLGDELTKVLNRDVFELFVPAEVGSRFRKVYNAAVKEENDKIIVDWKVFAEIENYRNFR